MMGAGPPVKGEAQVPPPGGLPRDALDVQRAIEDERGGRLLAHRGNGDHHKALAQMANLLQLGLRVWRKGPTAKSGRDGPASGPPTDSAIAPAAPVVVTASSRTSLTGTLLVLLLALAKDMRAICGASWL